MIVAFIKGNVTNYERSTIFGKVKKNILITFQSSCPGAKIGFNKAMAKGWLSMDKKAEGGPRIMRKVLSTCETFYMYTWPDH